MRIDVCIKRKRARGCDWKDNEVLSGEDQKRIGDVVKGRRRWEERERALKIVDWEAKAKEWKAEEAAWVVGVGKK